MQLTPAAIAKLVAYSWPGNVRELRTDEKIAVLSGSESVSGEEIEKYLSDSHLAQVSIDDSPACNPRWNH